MMREGKIEGDKQKKKTGRVVIVVVRKDKVRKQNKKLNI